MKKTILAIFGVASIVTAFYFVKPEPALAATGGTTNVVAAWDLISGGQKPVWQRMVWERLLVQCATVYAEPESTPNHRSRIAWVQQFYPYGTDPTTVIPVSSFKIMHLIIAQPDVAYAIASGFTGDDSLVGPIDSIVTNNCPPAQ